MKAVISMAVLGGFAAVAITVAFGLQGGCLFTNFPGSSCVFNDVFSFIQAHLDFLRIFSTADFTILIIVLFVLLGAAMFQVGNRLTQSRITFSKISFSAAARQDNQSESRTQFLSWLARHENSPSGNNFCCRRL